MMMVAAMISAIRARPRPPKLGWNAKIAMIRAASAHSFISPIACLYGPYAHWRPL